MEEGEGKIMDRNVYINIATGKSAMLELQLKMATTSINHEYARMEYDESDCRLRQEELLDYMQDCRSQYFEAREELGNYDTNVLAEFERDLMQQKQQVLVHYQT